VEEEFKTNLRDVLTLPGVGNSIREEFEERFGDLS
jgi:hypothetical protein